MSLRSIVYLYRVRLRSRIVQELLALAGIAVGVALLFAAQVSSASLTGSVSQLTSGIVGQARYELAARDPGGFSERVATEVERLPGVATAVPVLQESASVVGPRGERSVDLIGIDPRLAHLGGTLLRHFSATQLAEQKGLALPVAIAHSVGVTSLQTVRLRIGAGVTTTLIGAELGESEIGALANSPVVVAPLAYAQSLTGMDGRVTSVFVRPLPGRVAQVRAGLLRVADGGLNVQPANFEATLFRSAARPTTESTSIFAALSALVGFLFAFNAMLLTVPRRRELVVDLSLDGYGPWSIVKVVLFDGLMLGVAGTVLGLVLGDALSFSLFHANPSYLTFAFPIGSQRIVTWQSVVIAAAGGILAAIIGVMLPLRRQIFAAGRGRSVEAHSGERLRGRWWLAGGLAALLLTTVILVFAPDHAVIGVVSLTAAMLLLLPGLLDVGLAVMERLSLDSRSAAPWIAVLELRARATRARTIAIAATGAVGVFGSVAIQGAHVDLLQGLYRLDHEVSGVADLWVAPPGTENLLTTTPFRSTDAQSLARLPGVSAVRSYRAGLLDLRERRVWVLAPPRAARDPIPASQIVQGKLQLATERVRAGGWAVVAQTIADEYHLHIGQRFTLPSPQPSSFRVAALSTNMGWSPGSIIINADDYARAWGSSDPSAYNVILAPGASPETVRREIRAALGPSSGLAVETVSQLNNRKAVATRQGLVQLSEISLMVLVGAILAMAAAMGAMIWQRRQRLAQLKLDGVPDATVWRVLLLESVVLLGAGCSAGAVFGLYGQLLMTRALVAVTGYPVLFSVGLAIALGSFALVTAVAVAITAIPGYLAARVHPAAGV